MSNSILSRALASIDAALMRAKHDSKGPETLLTQDLEDAFVAVQEAIEAVQGAREDAHRMSGRVPVCTELLDMLAPDECTFEELLAKHPKLDAAFLRLMRLDANGASATETDIRDWVQDGTLPPDVAARFAEEIIAACDRLETEEA